MRWDFTNINLDVITTDYNISFIKFFLKHADYVLKWRRQLGFPSTAGSTNVKMR